MITSRASEVHPPILEPDGPTATRPCEPGLPRQEIREQVYVNISQFLKLATSRRCLQRKNDVSGGLKGLLDVAQGIWYVIDRSTPQVVHEQEDSG